MIYAICGPIGSGKSFYQLRRVIETAQRDKKWIVSNVPLNLDVLHRYCIARGFHWLAAQIRRGRVFIDTNFARVGQYGRAVILADELGIFMNNREGKSAEDLKLRMRFIKALILSRKAKVDLFWVAQDEELVDQQIRRLTQFYIHCYNSEPKAQKATASRYFIRSIYEGSVKYQKWFKSQRFATWLKYKMASQFSMPGNPLWKLVFQDKDDMLFGAYDTHYRLDETVTHFMDKVAVELGQADDVAQEGRVYHGTGLQVPGKFQPIQVPEGYTPGDSATLDMSYKPALLVDIPWPVREATGYVRNGIRWVRTHRAGRWRGEVWKSYRPGVVPAPQPAYSSLTVARINRQVQASAAADRGAPLAG